MWEFHLSINSINNRMVRLLLSKSLFCFQTQATALRKLFEIVKLVRRLSVRSSLKPNSQTVNFRRAGGTLLSVIVSRIQDHFGRAAKTIPAYQLAKRKQTQSATNIIAKMA